MGWPRSSFGLSYPDEDFGQLSVIVPGDQPSRLTPESSAFTHTDAEAGRRSDFPSKAAHSVLLTMMAVSLSSWLVSWEWNLVCYLNYNYKEKNMQIDV